MKLAKQWISEHGQSGEYPKEGVPIGCFTEAQIREIQRDAADCSFMEHRRLIEAIVKDQLAQNQEEK